MLLVIGAGIFAIWAVIAFTWGLWAPDPFKTNQLQALQSPSWEHWMGTDSLGRDVLARVLAGSSTVLTIAPAATFLTMLIGVSIGAYAGFRGGLFDDIAVRVIDLLLAFPSLIIVVMVLALFGSGNLTLIVILAIFFSPLTARVIRGSVHNVRNADFVDAARMRGDGRIRIIATEVLPNIVPTIGVEATMRLAASIIALSSLSFLGLGVTPPTPDWGLMIATEARSITFAWWASVFPAAALGSLVLAVAFIAEGLRRRAAR